MNRKALKLAGRPRSFDRDEALERAMQVFWQKGFEGASLSDLTAAMGIQPTSLYKGFGNKQSLFEQALALYLAGPVAFIHSALRAPTGYAVAEGILHQTAEFLTRKGERTGCMTIQAALVGSAAAEPVRRKLVALRVKEQESLRRRFARAISEGDLPPTADAADLARFITTIFQGMTVQAIDGANHKELLRLSDFAMRAWPR